MGKYRIANKLKKDGHILYTREAWAKQGKVIIEGHAGEVMYTSRHCTTTAVYFYDHDVNSDKTGAEAYLAELRMKRNCRRRELYRDKVKEEKERIEAIRLEAELKEMEIKWNKVKWAEFFKDNPKVLFFDTETTGLDAKAHNILSLSWQLVTFYREDLHRKPHVIERANYYFTWPKDESRVTDKAIWVNGLTKERLSILGTTDKLTAIKAFISALKRAKLCVAHNASFDIGFIDWEARRQGYLSLPWPKVLDTMTETTEWCGLGWNEGEINLGPTYKWPKLWELAEELDVDTSDINFHFSEADVEVTKRCFMAIVENGITFP